VYGQPEYIPVDESAPFKRAYGANQTNLRTHFRRLSEYWLQLFKRDHYLREGGYKILQYHE
jgi:hypothetical protein